MFCEICCSNKTIKKTALLDLGKHLQKTHGLSKNGIKNYYDKYLKKADEGMCYCGDKTQFLRINLGYSKYCSCSCSSKMNIGLINIKNWANESCRRRMIKPLNASRLSNEVVKKRMKSLHSDEFRQKCSNRMKKQWAYDEKYSKKMKNILLNNYMNKSNCTGPNKKETQLLSVLNEFEFEFTGTNCEKSVAGKFPDFINKNKNLIIELYGNYWHRNETEKQTKERIDLFKNEGYDTLIIWEHELKDLNSLNLRIDDFVKQEVRN